jgi:hypothetical protein
MPGKLLESPLAYFFSDELAVVYLAGMLALAMLDGNPWTLRTLLTGATGFLPYGLGDFCVLYFEKPHFRSCVR